MKLRIACNSNGRRAEMQVILNSNKRTASLASNPSKNHFRMKPLDCNNVRLAPRKRAERTLNPSKAPHVRKSLNSDRCDLLLRVAWVYPRLVGLAATLNAVLAPVAANAADLNINGVSDYASDADLEQVTSITQFSDVYPTDWAYQALANLIERYGCVAGYPNGTFRGNRAMTRYEAAALLNACLDRITEITDELRRLIKEFERELAIIRGRVDGLEARVGELESSQFSTTTKLKGRTSWFLGAVRAKGDAGRLRKEYNADYGATVFSYDLALALKTSFTGKDLLFTRLRSGNSDNAFGGAGFPITSLDYPTNTAGEVRLGRLYYRFPVGSNFTVVAGPRMRNTENLGYKPSAYTAGGHPQLDLFSGRLGVPMVWNKATGGGFGVTYKSTADKGDPYWTVAANYVAASANNGDPNSGGFMTDNAKGSITTQIAYGNKKWGVAAGYRYGQCDVSYGRGTEFARRNAFSQACRYSEATGDFDAAGNPIMTDKRSNADSNSWALNAFWRPSESGLIPSISASLGKSYLGGDYNYNTVDTFASWMVGLQWSDVFMMGNDMGFAVGQPMFAAAMDKGTPDDGNYAMELWYEFQVTDNISIAPGVYWLSRPLGELTPDDKSFGIFGGVVQTKFLF